MCNFPLCKRHPQSNGYCIGHSIYASTHEVKPAKAIPKRSEKEKVTIAQLKKEYKQYLSKPGNLKCKIKSPVCIKEATCVNHTNGRGINVLNQKDWEPCCPPCNDYIEAHHEWAAERGHKKQRHKKTA